MTDRIQWDKLSRTSDPNRILFVRSLTSEKKEKLSKACSATIDFLLTKLKLKKWECYFVVKTLFEEFPVDQLIEEEEKQK